tara:strand:+ start:945 stop:1088 length:144 start_codon:yes stop_codon:yes gene_type:complete
MGCGCGKAKEPVRKISSLNKAKQVVRELWEKTQISEQPIVVKRINKK